MGDRRTPDPREDVTAKGIDYPCLRWADSAKDVTFDGRLLGACVSWTVKDVTDSDGGKGLKPDLHAL
jgi:hypothetical protein